jgi:hypothetical protein
MTQGARRGRDFRAFTPVFDGLMPGHDVRMDRPTHGPYYFFSPFLKPSSTFRSGLDLLAWASRSISDRGEA